MIQCFQSLQAVICKASLSFFWIDIIQFNGLLEINRMSSGHHFLNESKSENFIHLFLYDPTKTPSFARKEKGKETKNNNIRQKKKKPITNSRLLGVLLNPAAPSLMRSVNEVLQTQVTCNA